MNQHMKKLADQARFTHQVPYPSEDEVFQKFGELLIRECAAMAECFHHNQYDYTGNLELHEFIKQHFGVLE